MSVGRPAPAPMKRQDTASQLLEPAAAAARGEEITITQHGKPVAKLVLILWRGRRPEGRRGHKAVFRRNTVARSGRSSSSTGSSRQAAGPSGSGSFCPCACWAGSSAARPCTRLRPRSIRDDCERPTRPRAERQRSGCAACSQPPHARPGGVYAQPPCGVFHDMHLKYLRETQEFAGLDGVMTDGSSQTVVPF